MKLPLKVPSHFYFSNLPNREREGEGERGVQRDSERERGREGERQERGEREKRKGGEGERESELVANHFISILISAYV